jgi:hypothetical protein
MPVSAQYCPIFGAQYRILDIFLFLETPIHLGTTPRDHMDISGLYILIYTHLTFLRQVSHLLWHHQSKMPHQPIISQGVASSLPAPRILCPQYTGTLIQDLIGPLLPIHSPDPITLPSHFSHFPSNQSFNYLYIWTTWCSYVF